MIFTRDGLLAQGRLFVDRQSPLNRFISIFFVSDLPHLPYPFSLGQYGYVYRFCWIAMFGF